MTLKSDPNFEEKLTFCLKKRAVENLEQLKIWKFVL